MTAGEEQARWNDAALVAALIAVDPVGLGGVCVHAAHGPAREAWLDLLRACLPAGQRLRRMPSHTSESRLLGGLDLTATLQAGRPVVQRGVLAEADGGYLLLPMAERLSATVLAQLAAVLDTGTVAVESEGLALRMDSRFGVIALDESGADEDGLRPALLDRLAFWLDLDGLRRPQSGPPADALVRTLQARERLAGLAMHASFSEGLCVAALRLGVASLRASLLALRVARAHAALQGHDGVTDRDAEVAARLVLGPRATVLPQAEPPPPEDQDDAPEGRDNADDGSDPPPPPPNRSEQDPTSDPPTPLPELPIEELLLAAAQAAIPRGLLDRLRAAAQRPAAARSDGRAGALRQSLLRGRPAGVRRGEPRAGVRLNLIETLRAAAPWQPLRRAQRGASARRVEIRSEDFHITRYQQRTQTTTIFLVDASGSSALNRLAEAKGAVELLLADCYVRRDQVAVISFRGRGADLLLPPTRSLVRAKRSLAGLPGGGGTPLASGLDAGLALAEQLRRGGQTPTLVLLTDGRANVAMDGSGGRERAENEARQAARRIGMAGVLSLFVDTAPRPQPAAATLAADMGARYLPLPFADAGSLSAAVKTGTRRTGAASGR